MKGVQSEEDVYRSLESGAGGIWVSNHGGRQLDGGPAAFDSLQYVAEAVDKRVPIVFDSGVRRGQQFSKQSHQVQILLLLADPLFMDCL